jgi:hypothetical protein
MALHLRRALDPRWLTHHRRVARGFMTRQIEIHVQITPAAGWDPVTDTLTGGGTTLLWTGEARVQGNKDWRARSVLAAQDPQMVHYVRVQIPFDEDNEVPDIPVDAIIKILPPDPDSTWAHDDDLGTHLLRVRNNVNSSNPWLRNLLCGVDVSEVIP